MGVIENNWDVKVEHEIVRALQTNVDGEFLTVKTPLGSLSHNEWAGFGWCAICAWISVKAEEAVESGMPLGLTIRTIPMQDPEPWEAGTIGACLPALGDVVEKIGVDKAIGTYTKAEIRELLWTAIKLYRAAEAGRNAAEQGTLLPSKVAY